MPDPERDAAGESRQPTEHAVRERIIQLAFGGDRDRYATFVQALHRVIPRDVTVILRGSAVTGHRWADGQPFDADGPGTSDLDLTLVGGDMLKLWREDGFYIPKLHTMPLSDKTPDVAPVFVPLRRALCTIAGRPVNIQATSNLVQYMRDVIFDQPFYVLIEKEDGADEGKPVAHREERRADPEQEQPGGRRLQDAREAEGERP